MSWYTDNGYSKDYEKKMTAKSSTTKTVVSKPKSTKTVLGKSSSSSTTRSRSSSSSSNTSTYNGQTFDEAYVDNLNNWASDPSEALAELNRVKDAISSSGGMTVDSLAHYQRINDIVNEDKHGSSVGSGLSNGSMLAGLIGTGQVIDVESVPAENYIDDIPFIGNGALGGSVGGWVETFTNFVDGTLTEEQKVAIKERAELNNAMKKSNNDVNNADTGEEDPWLLLVKSWMPLAFLSMIGLGVLKAFD